MGKIIAIANHKGGVGKTTTTALIGEALSRKGKNVLLVDLDAQANLTAFFMGDGVEKSIYDALVEKEDIPIYPVGVNLSISPSELALAKAEIELSTRMARERILSNIIETVRPSYDYILLDCPPSLGLITTNALVAADELYIPLTAEALPLKGMKMLEDVVGEIREYVNRRLHISGIIITRYNNRKLNKAVLEAIKESYGDKLFNTMIRENIAVAETPLYGGNIYEYAPESNGATDYMNLAEEIINR